MLATGSTLVRDSIIPDAPPAWYGHPDGEGLCLDKFGDPFAPQFE